MAKLNAADARYISDDQHPSSVRTSLLLGGRNQWSIELTLETTLPRTSMLAGRPSSPLPSPAGPIAPMAVVTPQDRAAQLFRQLDADSDGVVTKGEFLRGLRADRRSLAHRSSARQPTSAAAAAAEPVLLPPQAAELEPPPEPRISPAKRERATTWAPGANPQTAARTLAQPAPLPAGFTPVPTSSISAMLSEPQAMVAAPTPPRATGCIPQRMIPGSIGRASVVDVGQATTSRQSPRVDFTMPSRLETSTSSVNTSIRPISSSLRASTGDEFDDLMPFARRLRAERGSMPEPAFRTALPQSPERAVVASPPKPRAEQAEAPWRVASARRPSEDETAATQRYSAGDTSSMASVSPQSLL